MTYQHALRFLTERDAALPYLDTAPLSELLAQVGASPVIVCLPHDKCGHLTARMLRRVLQEANISCLHAIDSDREEARERFQFHSNTLPPSFIDLTRTVHELELRARRAAKDKNATIFPPAHRTAATLALCSKPGFRHVTLLECESTSPWLRAMCELLPKPPVCITVVSPTDEGGHTAQSTIPYTTHSVISHACGQPLYRMLSDACARAGNLPLRIIPSTGVVRSSVTLGSQRIEGTLTGQCRLGSGTQLAAKAAALTAYAVNVLRDLHLPISDRALVDGLAQAMPLGCAEPVSILPLLVVDRAENAFELAATMDDLTALEHVLPRPRRVWLDPALAAAFAPWRAFADELHTEDEPYAPSETSTSLWIGSKDFLRRLGYGQQKK
jgi:hypothetical protein